MFDLNNCNLYFFFNITVFCLFPVEIQAISLKLCCFFSFAYSALKAYANNVVLYLIFLMRFWHLLLHVLPFQVLGNVFLPMSIIYCQNMTSNSSLKQYCAIFSNNRQISMIFFKSHIFISQILKGRTVYLLERFMWTQLGTPLTSFPVHVLVSASAVYAAYVELLLWCHQCGTL